MSDHTSVGASESERLRKDDRTDRKASKNEVPITRLYPYQARTVNRVASHGDDALVVSPTGSGKTLLVQAIIGRGLARTFTHAIVAVPQQQIEDGFIYLERRYIAYPKGLAAEPMIELPPSLIEAARASGSGTRRHVRRYLGLGNPEHAIACTHAALTGMRDADLPATLKGAVLFVDEAHHAPAEGLARVCAMWRARGGRIIFFTATPYRGDGLAVALPGMRVHSRSLAEHMEEGYAPALLESEIVALGKRGDRISSAQFRGEVDPPRSYERKLVQAIVARWVADGRPKLIVRVPPAGGRGRLVRSLCAAFAKARARVLDATGTRGRDKRRFLDGLRAERGRCFAESQVDVIVGIQRVLEGTDWPVCSAAYSVGVPCSLTTVVQFAGRALRSKPESYPSDYRNKSRLVFFVPCSDGEALASLSLEHSRHALLVSVFLADHRVGQEWIVTRAVKAGIAAAFAIDPDEPGDTLDVAAGPMSPEVRAEATLAVASARAALTDAHSEPPTTEQGVERAREQSPHLPAGALERIAVETLASDAGEVGETVRRRIRARVSERIRLEPEVQQAMREAFALVLEDFRQATLASAPALDEVQRQIHNLTGGAARAFVQRLIEAGPRPLAVEQILAWADQQHASAGRWPNADTGTVHGAEDETWRGIDSALRLGCRTLPGGSSLAQLLHDARGVLNRLGQPRLDKRTILAWADAYMAKHRTWPKRNSGAIEGTTDSWSSVDQALIKGTRGLPPGDSLARLLARERRARNVQALPPLSEDQILAWADRCYETYGLWPTRSSGQIDGAAPGETWSRVAAALEQGLRGLARWTSLVAFLAARRGARTTRQVRLALTEALIVELAKDFNRRNPDAWPSESTSDPVLTAKGLTWRKIDRALRQGWRGLPGGSSLSRLLATALGGRNGNSPDTLDHEGGSRRGA